VAVAYEHLDPVKRIISFADQRISEIESQITLLNREKQLWEDIKNRMNPCNECNGYGEIQHIGPEPDESHHEKCRACKGTGQRNSEVST
jgi:hypothetical protein